MVVRYDSLGFAQRSKPPLDLEAFISSNAFYNPTFFYKQFELTRFVFALITNVLKSRGEVDTTGGTPIMLYNALELYFSLILDGLGNSNEIEKRQDARYSYEDQKQCDSEHLSHFFLLFQIADRKSIRSVRSASSGISKAVEPIGSNGLHADNC